MNNFDELKEQISKNIFSNLRSIKLKLNKEDNFFTLKGKFEKLQDEQFIIISLGTKSNPFHYDVKFIQNENLSEFKKKYAKDFFKFGWNVNDINKEELYLYIFTSNVDSDFDLKKMHLNSFSTIKKYSNLHSCNKIKSSKDFINKFIILDSTNKNKNIFKLKEGQNIFSGKELKPNQKYKLEFEVRYGLFSMARASVLLGPKYIIDQTFFLSIPNPFYLSKKIIFTTPASLTSNDEIRLLFGTQVGLRSKFKNIVLEEVNK